MGATYLGAARPMRGAPAAATASAPAVSTSRPALTTAIPAAVAAVPVAAAPVVGITPFRFAAVARGTGDLQCLTEAVYFESRGEPDRGQQAVAQVVLNRVRHPAFPKTICAVVHQKTVAGCQFSFACAPEPARRDEAAWTHARDVARGALHGAVMRDIGDATHFESVRAMAFAGLLKVARIGEHVFYRFGGHDGAKGMFRQTPAPSVAAPQVMLVSAAPVAAAPTAPAGAPVPVKVQVQTQAAPVARPVLVATTSPAPPPFKLAAPATALPAPPVALIPASAAAPAVTPASMKTPPTTVALAS